MTEDHFENVSFIFTEYYNFILLAISIFTGVPSFTPPLSGPKLKYKFPFKNNSPITMPIVLSKAPPHKRLSSMIETDSSADEVETCDGVHHTKMLFEVRACVREKEEVRITGNIPYLGTWDIFSSVKLNKSIE